MRLASSQSAFQAQLGPPIRGETLFALKHERAYGLTVRHHLADPLACGICRRLVSCAACFRIHAGLTDGWTPAFVGPKPQVNLLRGFRVTSHGGAL